MKVSTEPTSAPKISKSARRGNGEGSINRRADGRYQACYTADGKRHFLYGKTRAEVAKKLAATLRDRDKGLPVGLNERQTTQHYLTSWLEMMEQREARRPALHDAAEHRLCVYTMRFRSHSAWWAASR